MTAKSGALKVSERARERLEKSRTTLWFALSWALLDVMLNLRYPADEPAFWYLAPAIDVVVLFAYFALFARLNFRVPKALRVALVLWLLLVRLIRIGDGFQTRYFAERFNLWSDLRLLPELARFAYSSLSFWLLVPLCVAVPLLLAGLFLACYRALEQCERYLADSGHVQGVAAIVAVFLALGLVPHDPHYKQLYFGGFGASSIPRLRHEAKFLLNMSGYRTANVRAIADMQERLRNTPVNLEKLHGRNVYLILVESYGATVFERPDFARRVDKVFQAFERRLGARGFSLATGLLDSPTSGGRSWLAHATLATGVRTSDQLQYELLLASRPKPIARFFRDAGYRTVVAQPGTTRPWPKGDVFAFEQRYYAWNFEYAGPGYAWATMPDQYVLDFIRRRELASHASPLFIEYVLVSSHAPWSHQPILVEDWQQLGNGEIYNRLETVHFPIEWPHFKEASEAYIRSIVYDLEVIQGYLEQFVSDDSLIIVLGDHQPIPEVAGASASVSVPVHVLSRDPALVEPFRARGYARGMRPGRGAPHPPMAGFLPNFLRDFSSRP
jgi:hypothetical protein